MVRSNELLAKTAEEGEAIRQFCRTPGFKIYKEKLESIIEDRKNVWLRGTEEEAKQARFEARGVQRALDELKKYLIAGDYARQVLTDLNGLGEAEQPVKGDTK